MTYLVLAGTAEGYDHAMQLAQAQPDSQIIYSLAGQSPNPKIPPAANIQMRSGGFGGVAGLYQFIINQGIQAVIVHLHPFARTMLANVQQVQLLCPNIIFEYHQRPGWGLSQFQATMDDIIITINQCRGRVLCALGSQHLPLIAPYITQQNCWLRALKPPTQPHPFAQIILSPPLDYAGEKQFLRANAIALLVARDSGGEKSFQKIQAAMDLGIDIRLIAR